jgi:hypothetical protein
MQKKRLTTVANKEKLGEIEVVVVVAVETAAVVAAIAEVVEVGVWLMKK